MFACICRLIQMDANVGSGLSPWQVPMLRRVRLMRFVVLMSVVVVWS